MPSRPFDQIVVHVGQHKTGTTHIQTAMARNAEALLAQGIFYPLPREGGTAHHSLVRSFYAAGDPALARPLLGQPGDDELVMAALKAQKGAKTAVLSSELLAAHAEMNAEGMRSLDRRLSKLAGTVRYVAYVRAPSERFPAVCSQSLMRTAILPRQDWAMRTGALVKLLEVVGPRLQVRRYDRASFPNGDVLADFLKEAVGVDVPVSDFPVRAFGSNISLSAEAMYLVQSIAMSRQMANPESFPLHDAEMLDMVRFVRRLDQGQEYRHSAMLLPGIADVLNSRATEELAQLREAFGIDLASDVTNASASENINPLARLWVRNVFKVDPELTARLADDLRANPRCPEVLRDSLDRVLMPGK